MPLETTLAPENILIVGPSWVGDMVMANSLFQVLKHFHPQCRITVLSPPWCLALLERMTEVDQALSLPFGHGVFAMPERWRFGLALRPQHFNLALILPNSWKSAIIPFAAGIPERRGWRGELRYGLLTDCRKLDKQRFPSMVSRFNALAAAKNCAPPAIEPVPHLCATDEQQRQTRVQLGLNHAHYIALCPGAEFGMAKRWPPEHYATLCAMILNAGWQPILLGSPKDADTTDEILNHLPPPLNGQVISFAGKTSLTQAIDLLAGASAVVSNDSGLMHIAAAFDRPLIALYGPTSSTFTPPISARAKVLQLNLDCQPCHQRACPLPTGNTHHACMKRIRPEQVFSELMTQLNLAPPTDHA